MKKLQFVSKVGTRVISNESAIFFHGRTFHCLLNLYYFSHLPDTCSDGIKNQDEEDIDCGGAVCPACALKHSKCIDYSCILKCKMSMI